MMIMLHNVLGEKFVKSESTLTVYRLSKDLTGSDVATQFIVLSFSG